MNPKHTPKPWKVDYDSDGDDFRTEHWPWRIIATNVPDPKEYGGKKVVCEFEGSTTEANARLIASAPDLLEALELAVGELRWFIQLNSSPQMAEFDWKEYQDTAIMQTINTAISKATEL